MIKKKQQKNIALDKKPNQKKPRIVQNTEGCPYIIFIV